MRTAIIPPLLESSSSESAIQDYLRATINVHRRGLDPDNLHTNWLVTDAARWNTGTGGLVGYCFQVREMNAGSPTGKEFCHIFAWHASVNYQPDDYMQSEAAADDFFYMRESLNLQSNRLDDVASYRGIFTSLDSGDVEVDGFGMQFDSYAQGSHDQTVDYVDASGAGVFTVGEVISTPSGKAIFVSEDAGADTITFHYYQGEFKDGETITGGTSGATRTLATPANPTELMHTISGTTPDNNLASWMPTNAGLSPRGIFFDHAERQYDRFELYIYDDAKPFMAVYMTRGEMPFFDHKFISGDLVIPVESPPDTNTWLNWTATHYIGTGDWSRHEDSFSGYIDDAASGLRSDGTKDIFHAHFFTPFGFGNWKRASDSKASWLECTLTDDGGNEFRGRMDPDVIRIMGAGAEFPYATFDHETDPTHIRFIHSETFWCYPWVPGLQASPPIPWNLLDSFVQSGA